MRMYGSFCEDLLGSKQELDVLSSRVGPGILSALLAQLSSDAVEVFVSLALHPFIRLFEDFGDASDSLAVEDTGQLNAISTCENHLDNVL